MLLIVCTVALIPERGFCLDNNLVGVWKSPEGYTGRSVAENTEVFSLLELNADATGFYAHITPNWSSVVSVDRLTFTNDYILWEDGSKTKINNTGAELVLVDFSWSLPTSNQREDQVFYKINDIDKIQDNDLWKQDNTEDEVLYSFTDKKYTLSRNGTIVEQGQYIASQMIILLQPTELDAWVQEYTGMHGYYLVYIKSTQGGIRIYSMLLNDYWRSTAVWRRILN
jgi:hypothetical protein